MSSGDNESITLVVQVLLKGGQGQGPRYLFCLFPQYMLLGTSAGLARPENLIVLWVSAWRLRRGKVRGK